MVLQPCDCCRRHIDRHAAVCPFCAAVVISAPPRAMLAGRLSRAVLFASATLVGCDQGAKPVAPASGSAAIKAPTTTWRLHGVVKDSQGTPLAGATLHMTLEGQPTIEQPAPITAIADAKGRYQVEGATAGRYNVSISWSGDRGNAYTSEIVAVVIGTDHTWNATMDPSVPAMPYGAPPSRRRVV